MMMKINDYLSKYILKNQATPNLKFHQNFCSIGLNTFGIYLRDGGFDSIIGIVLYTHHKELIGLFI